MARQKLKPKPDPMLQEGYEVDNPFFSASAPEEQKTIKVTRTLRRDQLAWLHSRDTITEAQYRAGRDYQRFAEDESISIGMDISAEPVDQGRRLPAILTDKQLRAIKRMEYLRGCLGIAGTRLADEVMLNGQTFAEYARRYHYSTSDATLIFVGRRFREVLDTLSAELGYGG